MKSIIKKTWTNKEKGYIKFGIANCSVCDKDQKIRVQNWKRKKENYQCRSCCHQIDGENRGKSRLYTIYQLMKRRCNPTSRTEREAKHYQNIEVCEDWKKDYLNFKKWAIINGYKDNLEIDRINSDKGYEPNNCRWATRSQQMQNIGATSRCKSGLRGIFYDKSRDKWVYHLSIEGKVYRKRMNTVEEAIEKRNAIIKREGSYHVLI